VRATNQSRRREFTSFRALDRQHRQLRPFTDPGIELLGLFAQPREVFFASGGVDHKPVVRVVNIVDDKVIDDATLLVQHAGIKCLSAHRQLGHVVGQEVAKKFPGPLTGEVHDGHVRYVEDAGMLPYGVVLFLLRAVVQRHVPATEIDDARAGSDVLIKKRRFFCHYGSRVKQNRATDQTACRPSVLENLRDR
jgi:hypothetical protein